MLATVIGSGVMAFKLAQGNGAIALLCNTIPTGAILTVLILAFGPVSGAHFNPAVTIAFALRRELSWQVTVLYITVQVIGAISGVWAAHVMFELPVWAVDAYPPGELLLRNPTTGIADCCARAASGHPMTAPLARVMNSRRLMRCL
ncbi:MAG: aquaporin [Xanthobacteraceae bacterium]